MSEKYKVRDQEKIYFITFAVIHWVDVFTRREYKDLLVESLQYCQREKGLEIYAWCLMSNHIHLALGRQGRNKLSDIIRDLKKYSSVALVRAIAANGQESRKEWMLDIFKKAAENSSKHQQYQLWQNQYHPMELTSPNQQERCLPYIHNNPVKAGMVAEAEHYLYSSAIDYAGGKGLLIIKFME
jgi:putative transposase